MRVLITRPEREATALATALVQRGHAPVIAPLFTLQILHPPPDFASALAAGQAVLLTSANGARALAEANDQRSKPVFAVGDTTAATAEGLGFTSVVSASGDAAALAALVRERLDPAKGSLVHVSGLDVAGDLSPEGFEVRRFPLYEAREADSLPASAVAALQARALDAAIFFSPRASAVFARLAEEAGVAGACDTIAAVAISPAAAEPLKVLPFQSVRIAARPTRQAMLDEIDRLPEAVVKGHQPMTDTPSLPPPEAPATSPVIVHRGLGPVGAFVIGLVAAVIVLAGALLSLPYWPDEAKLMWRGPVATPPAPAAAPAPVVDTAAIDAAKRELTVRLDDLDKRVRAVATTAAQADRGSVSDPAIAELRGRITGLESRPAVTLDTEKDVAALKGEITKLQGAMTEAADKAKADASALSSGEQKALAAARASAVIGIAARLSAALDSGLPFATDLGLLAPLAKDDPKLGELVTGLQPLAATGVAGRTALAAAFPAGAKAALADDLADDSFGERLLGKLKGLVSLRRVGADVEGDTVEAKLARAEAALNTGDVAKAVALVKSLPPQAAKATAAWLARAEAHLAAQRAVDQLAAHAVALLGAAK
ncbi:MAG: uroporphyrinogen-III synthase [Enhydrobacter sp.]